MKDFFKKWENVFSLVLLISFFLPWVDFGIVSIPGYKIVSVGQGLSDLASAFGNENTSLPPSLYLVYLIPLLSLLIMYMSYKEQKPKLLSAFTGIFIVLAFFYYLLVGGDLGYVGIGAYLTLIAGGGLILSAFNIIKSE